MIAWKYIDKRAAAIDALRDYESMEHIIANYELNEIDLRERMTAVRSPAPTGMPHNSAPQAGETRLVAQIDEIDVLKECYRQALEFMRWFRPAWMELSEDERFVLEEFFVRDDTSKTDAILNISEKLFVERAQVYRKKDKALSRLTVLLYGK